MLLAYLFKGVAKIAIAHVSNRRAHDIRNRSEEARQQKESAYLIKLLYLVYFLSRIGQKIDGSKQKEMPKRGRGGD